jgi:filamentous hemagglutinin family protein
MKTMKSENRSGFMKRLLIGLLVFLLGGYPSFAFALPNGGNVVGGSGTIGGTNPNMVINQNSDKLIINWNDFSIGSSESVQFIQPGTSSIALNRVVGVNPSNILGTLSGNGQIWLVNPNGVFFGANSVVNAHGIFVSTLDISDPDFLNDDGIYNFSQVEGKSLTSIINEGTFNVSGYVGLLGPAVVNNGTIEGIRENGIIVANLGSVALGSAQAATVDFTGDGLINFVLTEGVAGDEGEEDVNGEVTNTGSILANGGQVSLTAKDAGGVVRSVVNNTGVIEANTVVEKEGKIILAAGDNGVVTNSGKLSVAGDDDGEKAGTIELSGEDVKLFDSDDAEVNVSGEDGGGLLSIEATNKILVALAIDTTGEVDMTAGNGIEIEEDLTAGGTIDINSDSDADGEGLLDIKKLITTGADSDINITAAEMDWEGLDSSGDVTFTQSYTDPESEYEGIGISGEDFAKITTNDLTISTEGGIMVASVTAEDTEDIKGTTTLNAESVVFGEFDDDESDFDGPYDPSSTFTNGLAVNAANGILITANLTSLNGGMSFNADSNNDGYGTFGIYGVDVVSTDQLISITAADFEMASGLDAGEGNVDIKASSGRSIEINGDEEWFEEEWYPTDQINALESSGLPFNRVFDEGSDVMEISGYELGNITAKNISFHTDGSITVDGGESGIEVNSPVYLFAGNGIAMYGDLSFGGTGANLFFADTNRDGTGDFYVDSEASVTTGNNPIVILANDIDIQGDLNAAGIIVRVSDGGTIGLDGHAESSDKSAICGDGSEECGMTISQSEIDKMNSRLVHGENITPVGIEFGDGSAGAITVDDINLSSHIFALRTGGTINDIDDGAANITTTNGLVLDAGGDIGNLGGDEGLNLDVAALSFSNGANDNFTATNENSSTVDQNFGAVTDGTANISYTLKNGNLLVDTVSTQGDVNLEATTGSILDGNDVVPDSPGITNVRGDNVTLVAQSSIGEESNVLEVEANTLNTSITGPGDNVYVTLNGEIPGTIDPEQEEDQEQGTNSTFLTEFFENVAENSGC